jgi:ABC-2 type transport system permease protein
MFLEILKAEFLKLRGSAAPWVLIGGPILLSLLVLPMLAGDSARTPATWPALLTNSLQFWSLLILPLNVTTFAASYGQMEYRAFGWDFLAAAPVDRWKIYLAKIVVALCSLGILQALYLGGTLLSASIAACLYHKDLGALTLPTVLRANAVVWMAALLMLALQLWASFRLSNFVAPFMIGMTGTIVTVAALLFHRSEAKYLPWAFPSQVLARPPDPDLTILATSLLGAVLVMTLMTVDLVRREIR